MWLLLKLRDFHRAGPGSMVVVIKNLQQQCDVHSTKILSLFSQDTNMLKMVSLFYFPQVSVGSVS